MTGSRVAFVLALVASLVVTIVGGAQQPTSDSGVLDPALVAAWERAGAELFPREAVPTFRFDGVPQAPDFRALPAPRAPFGLNFNNATLTESHLKAIGSLKQLRAFRCYSCYLPNDAALGHLGGLLELQDLDFNHLDVSQAGLDQLAGLKGLRTLQLRGVSVTDRGLEWLSGLTQLETLRLPYTTIAPGTKSLSGLPQLRELYLQENDNNLDLTETHLIELATLKRLQVLSITGSNLKDEGLKKLAGLASLRTLLLNGSKVTGRGLSSLAGLSQLRGLDLRAELADEALDGLATLTALEALTVGSPKVTDAWLARLATLPNLRELSVTNSPVSDDGLKVLAGLKRLEVLRLNGSQVTGTGLKFLRTLEHLREVRLGSSRLTDAGLKELAGLAHLDTVGVHNTQITDAGVKHLASLTQLQTLVLGGDLTDESLPSLVTLPRLINLDLAGTITDAGLRILSRSPQLRDLWLPEDHLEGITIAGITDLTTARPEMTIDGRSGSAIRDSFEVDAAFDVKDAAARLAALERVRPKAKPPGRVDAEILSTLVRHWPDRTDRIAEVLDRRLAAIPEGLTPTGRLNATLGAVRPLVEQRVLLARAERALAAALTPLADKPARTGGLALLGRIYVAQGDVVRARKVIEEGLSLQPDNVTGQSTPIFSALAELELQQGDDRGALDHFTTAAALGTLPPAQDASVRALYERVHGTDAGYEESLNRRYRELLPNPVRPARYVPSGNSSKRVVLFELFTGSGCIPCIAADLAFEALLARYPSNAVTAVVYHQNVPRPDPMVISAAQRLSFHRPTGTPSVLIDGRGTEDGGGLREAAPARYASYVTGIDKALQTPAAAAISMTATGEGDQVTVRATVTGLSATGDGYRLRLLLVERELSYVGENGIRPHAMVVRAMADGDGTGMPIKEGSTTTHTFRLNAVAGDVAATLAGELSTRRKSNPALTFTADGHAQTTIDTSRLVVVAVVQQGAASDAAPNVLQAAQADVMFKK